MSRNIGSYPARQIPNGYCYCRLRVGSTLADFSVLILRNLARSDVGTFGQMDVRPGYRKWAGLAEAAEGPPVSRFHTVVSIHNCRAAPKSLN
jgi:hypothetical protein